MTRQTIWDLQKQADSAIIRIEGVDERFDKMEQDIYNLKMVDVMHDKELDKMRRRRYHLRIKKGGNEVVVKLG